MENTSKLPQMTPMTKIKNYLRNLCNLRMQFFLYAVEYAFPAAFFTAACAAASRAMGTR